MNYGYFKFEKSDSHRTLEDLQTLVLFNRKILKLIVHSQKKFVKILIVLT